jgi:hypothetical protein
VQDGRLSLLLEEFETQPLPVNIVYLGGGLLPLKVRAFLDFAAPRLKARLAGDLASASPHVVPANAGAHNHRCQ